METSVNNKYKAFTSLEQSRKLAEILPHESADMCYVIDYAESNKYGTDHFNLEVDTYGLKVRTRDNIPCWSLAALMNLLPSEFTEKGKYSETTYKIDIRKYALTEDVDLYQIAYGNYKFYEDGNSSWKDMINTGEKENLIDAAFDMICWLKENEKI